MNSSSSVVKQVSECFIKPKHMVSESNHPYYLTPYDLSMLSFQYIQKGLLFTAPSNSNYSIHNLLETLKDSLSITLLQYYPLAGQLSVEQITNEDKCVVFVDCNKGPGAKFTHATLNGFTVSDTISTCYVPQVVHAFFDNDRAVNCDGHTRPLLSVQVTELVDGVFIGSSINHAVADGTSFWQFWNTWSRIHRDQAPAPVSYPHLLTQKLRLPQITLPCMHPDEIVSRYQAPPLKERFFHFSSSVIRGLKWKANEESRSNTISSFQALTAFVWKAIVKATCRPAHEVTNCRLAVNNRPRINPPLPNHYFGNCVNVLNASTTVNELLNDELGWVASQLQQLVVNYDNSCVRDDLKQWLTSPVFFRLEMLDGEGITMSSSPRFDMYSNEFGLGKAVAVRSGSSNKFPGSVIAYPGPQGGGSIELEICLPSESMSALELDANFMAAAAASSSHNIYMHMKS